MLQFALPRGVSSGFSTRLVTCDQASLNLACEKAIQKHRDDGWTNLLLSCDPLGRRLPRQDGVSWPRTSQGCSTWPCGMTGSTRKFRGCVRDHVMRKIAWTETPPSRAATEWKEHMIEFFKARGLDNTELLRLCLQGVLQHSERIDICLGVHLKRFKEERLLKLAIAKGFIQSMCPQLQDVSSTLAGCF